MKKATFLLTLLLLLCLTVSSLAVTPDQIQGYQKRAWQYIRFGTYPTEADGTEAPILWRVLEVKNEQAYLLSEYILFAHRVDPNCYPINKNSEPYAGWETSELFNYLNADFLQTAFSAAEQEILARQEDGGLVSLIEINELKDQKLGFTAEKLRQAQSTEYAKANGLYVYQGGKKYSPYWSRTPSQTKPYAHRRVMDDGKLGYISVEVQNLGVRPVILLDLTRLTALEGSGTLEDPYRTLLPEAPAAAEETTAPAAPDEEEAPVAEEPAAEVQPEPGNDKVPAAPAAEEATPAAEEETAAADAEDSDFTADTAHDSYYPTLTEEGFLPEGEPEFIYKNEDAGLYLYASQDIRVEIVRREAEPSRNRPWRWYEADLYARPDSDEFLRVFYHDQNPKTKKAVEIQDIAYENKLVFSMNADWYYYRVLRNAKRKIMPVGLILRQGNVLYNDPAKKLWTTIPNRDIMALYPDGNMEVYDYNGITADELVAKKAYDVLSFGPVLLKDGEITEQAINISARQSDNPRSGVGLVEPGHYVCIVMEGKRRGVSAGCTVKEFAELFQNKGCTVAYNLDGGGTVSMMFMGEYVNRMGQFQANARQQIEALGLGVSESVHE